MDAETPFLDALYGYRRGYCGVDCDGVAVVVIIVVVVGGYLADD